MSRMSVGMGLMVHSVLLLLTSGAVFAYQVENGTNGGSVYFYESILVDDNPAITWNLNNAPVAQRFPSGTPVCVGQYVGRCELYVNGTLRLDRLTAEDNGNYTLIAQYPNSTLIKTSTYGLKVYTPVSNVKLTNNMSGWIWPGIDVVSLTCSAQGTVDKYSWRLQGLPLPNDSRYHFTENNRVLTISPVSANDTGTFTCTASGFNSENSNEINLKLGSKISVVTLTSNTSGSYIWVGEDSASLHCSADGSNVTFLWNLKEGSVPPGPQYHISSQGDSPPQSNLLISPVSKTDAGPFTCEASNPLGNETSKPLNLSLAWKPEGNIACSAMRDGQNIELGCSWSGGHPEANVSLTFNGTTTEIRKNNVTSLVSIGDNFQGLNLICHGNQLGRTSQCTVPIGSPSSPGHNNTSITDAKVGGTLNLTVTVEPGLPVKFTWQPPSNNISRKYSVNSTDFSSSYLIQDVAEEDAGQYKCIAENIIGNQSFLFTVKVSKAAIVPPTTTTPPAGLSGGAIAGIVIGVLAGVALIGIAVFFIVKKKKSSGDNKRISEPDDQLGATVTYATVQKKNGGVAETALTNNEQEDDVKYAELKFPNNNSTMATVPPPVETEYSTVKTSIKQ